MRRPGGQRDKEKTKLILMGFVIAALLIVLLIMAMSRSGGDRRRKAFRASMYSAKHRRKKTEGFTLFHLDKSRFVWAFADCLTDPHCTIQYLHERKTGGTYLKWAMAKILDVSKYEWYDNIWNKDCCNEQVRDRFLADPSSYCSRPFASYQTQQKIFTETMVETCKQLRKRVVVLTSFREPLTRALSWIHQVCNKNLRWRQEDELRACERCTYEADLDFFNRFKTLQGLDATMLSNSTFWSIMHGHDMLAIDNADLNEFLHLLELAMPESHEEQFKKLFKSTQAKNVEKTQLCEFSMPSSMMKNYSDEILLYRKIVLGENRPKSPWEGS